MEHHALPQPRGRAGELGIGSEPARMARALPRARLPQRPRRSARPAMRSPTHSRCTAASRCRRSWRSRPTHGTSCRRSQEWRHRRLRLPRDRVGPGRARGRGGANRLITWLFGRRMRAAAARRMRRAERHGGRSSRILAAAMSVGDQPAAVGRDRARGASRRPRSGRSCGSGASRSG